MILGKLSPTKDALSSSDLAKCHFMIGMPYYDEMIILKSGKKLSVKNRLFTLTLPNGSKVIGVRMPRSVESFVSKIGEDKALVLPYLVLIEHKESNTLFLGDNVMKNRLGGFDSSSSILGKIELLEEIVRNGRYALYVPGHGPSGAKEETVGPFLRYLKTLKKWAQKANDNEEEYYVYKDQVTRELGSIAHWDAYSHQMGKHLSKVYMEIEEKDME